MTRIQFYKYAESAKAALLGLESSEDGPYEISDARSVYGRFCDALLWTLRSYERHGGRLFDDETPVSAIKAYNEILDSHLRGHRVAMVWGQGEEEVALTPSWRPF